jgi:hypothetical protein
VKITLQIDDRIAGQLQSEAMRRGCTLSELVESALRDLLRAKPDANELSELPTFDSGGALVDIADRDALNRAFGSP